jgi:hypothetical protein
MTYLLFTATAVRQSTKLTARHPDLSASFSFNVVILSKAKDLQFLCENQITRK